MPKTKKSTDLSQDNLVSSLLSKIKKLKYHLKNTNLPKNQRNKFHFQLLQVVILKLLVIFIRQLIQPTPMILF